MQWFFAVERRITRLALELSIAALAIIVLLTFYQVVTRFVFGHPSAWSEVAARSVMMWMVFMGLAAAFRQGAMIAVDFLMDVGPKPLRFILVILIAFASLVFLGLLVWYGWSMAERVQRQNLAGLEISIAWVYAALPVGAALAVPGVVARFIVSLRELSSGADEADGAPKDVEGQV
ncbi:MAG: TRAP transporter permease DctQ [Stappia sp.]|uniref:TRAP transporter small permease n=1 Tax=Stappia sp. TaxID=1870903 RepID=UPI000C47334D|nr:TRAP transporter small permease [Stappia sp.]MAA96728.1 TRAP transporter permease DctQ [Stappia sp.]MBM21846.1 TRAP transporter permease DctQ [Stappia sp.]|tara:strand:+ start:756 stop:1283 length:528 start_codon:yes stop_codon:yes gene_type:complete